MSPQELGPKTAQDDPKRPSLGALQGAVIFLGALHGGRKMLCIGISHRYLSKFGSFAFGSFAFGSFAFASFGFGSFAFGSLAFGSFAFGSFAFESFAFGSFAFGSFACEGGGDPNVGPPLPRVAPRSFRNVVSVSHSGISTRYLILLSQVGIANLYLISGSHPGLQNHCNYEGLGRPWGYMRWMRSRYEIQICDTDMR